MFVRESISVPPSRSNVDFSIENSSGIVWAVDASDERQMVDIIPLGPKLLVSKEKSIKLDRTLTSNPNVGGFDQGDAEIVLQDLLRVHQGLFFFFAYVILAQTFFGSYEFLNLRIYQHKLS